MKLVKLLAKELAEWPEGAGLAVQDGDARKTVKFGRATAKPAIALMGLANVWQASDWRYTHRNDFDARLLCDDWASAIVTCAQWQAERDRQKGGEWKRHRAGRKQPIEDGVAIEVKWRDGGSDKVTSDRVDWIHYGHASDIMQYRIISQPQAEEAEVRKLEGRDVRFEELMTGNKLLYEVHCGEVIHGPVSMGDEIIAPAHPKWKGVDAAPDFSVGQWHQMETPFKWRDEVTELNAYIEKFTRERDDLIERLASEGFALIPPVVSVFSELVGVDMGDWRNWKEGDVIKVIANKGGHEFETGDEVIVIKIDDKDTTYRIEARKDGEDWWLSKGDGEFIRRP